MGSFFYLRALLAPQQRSGLNERPKTSFIGCPPFCHLLRETQASEASPGNHTVDYHVYFGSFLAIRPINVDTPKPLRSTKKSPQSLKWPSVSPLRHGCWPKEFVIWNKTKLFSLFSCNILSSYARLYQLPKNDFGFPWDVGKPPTTK